MKPVRLTMLLLPLLGALLLLAGCREEAVTAVPAAGSAPVAPTAMPAATPVCQNKDIPRITVDEVWRRLQAGEAIVIIDARSGDEYDIEHIAGAINAPEREFSVRANELPRGSLLVFYCT